MLLAWTILVMTYLISKSQKKAFMAFFLLKIIVCVLLTVVYYLDTFSLSYDPEFLLLGFYFNGFYIIVYFIDKNQVDETGEEINDPEVPTVLNIPSSDTDRDRDILPSYEESFNFPNSEFKNNKNVDNIDKTEIDGLDGGSGIKMYKIKR